MARYNKIEGMVPTLPIPLRIKVGGLGDKRKTKSGKWMRLPEQFGHFVITTTERGQDGNFIRDAEAMKELGTKPMALNVRLLYDNPWLNLFCRYLCWHEFEGCTDPVYCEGNKKEASRLQEDGSRKTIVCDPDTCEIFQGKVKGKVCKLDARLTVQLMDLPDRPGVCAQFKTTSDQAASSFLGTMQSIFMQTGGILAGIPLKLIIIPKQRSKVDPSTGETKLLRANYIVGLEQSQSNEDLLLTAGQISQRRITSGASQKLVEKTAAAIQAKQLESLPDIEGEAGEYYNGNDEEPHDVIPLHSEKTGEAWDNLQELMDVINILAETYWPDLTPAQRNVEIGNVKAQGTAALINLYEDMIAAQEAKSGSEPEEDTDQDEIATESESSDPLTADLMIAHFKEVDNFHHMKNYMAQMAKQYNDLPAEDKKRVQAAKKEREAEFTSEGQTTPDQERMDF